ncbi:MAG: hypothetical protein ACJ74L_07090 [Gaiellaceae bacterium]
MLRKIFTLGALVAVAVSFGVGTASANPSKKAPAPSAANSHGGWWSDGFSDGRD